MDFILQEGRLLPPHAIMEPLLRSENLERGLLPFEVMEARGLTCFKLREHLDRLVDSITACGMYKRLCELGPDEALAGYIAQAIGESGFQFQESVVRISMLDLTPDVSPALLISVRPKAAAQWTMALKTMPFIRFSPQVKLSGDYAHAQIALRKYADTEYSEMLYVHPYLGVVTEASKANFFAVVGTPRRYILYGAQPSKLFLPGITRTSLLDMLSERQEVFTRGGVLPYKYLGSITEAFITSTTKRIMPVSKIDNRSLTVGSDMLGGPVTRQFRQWFDEYVEKYYAENAK